MNLRDEVPHGVAVRIDEFKERENGMAYIAATLFVERESQKGIVIGEGGRMLKIHRLRRAGGDRGHGRAARLPGIARQGAQGLAQ